jgi:hypothetical protein
MPYGSGVQDTTDLAAVPVEEQKRKLRESGLSEALINQVLGMSMNDPAGLNKQYDMSAYLRRGAFTQQPNQSVLGAVAQGLMGGVAGAQDKKYGTAVRNYNRSNIAGRRAWLGKYLGRDDKDDAFNYRPEVGTGENDY